MFKSARWRSDKNKIKAIFKLQFHATQVSHLEGDALLVSVVPTDVGKLTVRLEKSTVQDGSCYWEKPVYETVKFVRDQKTGKIHERIYHFVVATASSKVGEVSIDFANYAVATKLSSVSLPLKNAKYEAVLHVSIQRMQDSVDQREDENENAKVNSQDRSLRSQLVNGDTDGSIKSNSTEDGSLDKTFSHVAELNGNCRASSGSDVTISSSESIPGLDTHQEPGMKNNNIHEDRTSFLSSLHHASVPQKPAPDVSSTIYEENQRSQWEWLGSSAPEVSTDDSSISPRETLIREMSEEASDILIEKLKTELAVLARQAEVSEMELQTLRKQIVKESKRGQDLSREVISLKEERDALKDECEKLKASQKLINEAKIKNKLKFEGGDPSALLEVLREEINYEKDLNANLRLQLRKTQESNSELILAVRDLDEMLEEKNREMLNISNKSVTSESVEALRETNSKCETDDDEEQRALEELVKEHSDGKEAYLLEQKIMDLYSEMEIYKRDKDELEMQMEQLALDYEILKQENHDISYKLEQSQLQEQLKMQYECSTSYATFNELENQIESLENELKNQSKEFSDSLVTIKDLETHIKSLEEELENQAQGFEADLEAITRTKVEQEQRAIRAEEILRKTRWQNANTAERLQEEVRRLSLQMASTFDANEKLAMKALIEANELRLQKSHLEEMLQKAKEDLRSVGDHYEAKLQELSSQITLKISQMEQMHSEIEGKSIELEHQRKHAEETHKLLSEEILMHSTEIERLTTENNILSEQAEQKENFRVELERMKASIEENEILVIRGITERDELESMFALVKLEEEKLLKELNIMRTLKDEKEYIIGNLQLEMETLKAQCNELKHSLFEDELEKEKLRKQVSKLKGDLKKEEDEFCTIEEKLKVSNARATVLEGAKATSRSNKSNLVPRDSKEVANLKEKIKLLESQINLKEIALETSTNSFLEKENDLQTKIEEFERRLDLEVLNQNATSFCGCEIQKVPRDTEDITLNDRMTVEVRGTAENSSTKTCMSNENGWPVLLINSNKDILSEKELKGAVISTRDQGYLNELLNEMALLKERNRSMDGELKEMQERYSEISLKFAEVEGERQQLVMTLRNLKNAKKS